MRHANWDDWGDGPPKKKHMRTKKKKRSRGMSSKETVEYIKKALGYKSLTKPPVYWLDLGSPYANKVFGSKKLGVAYGKAILLAGPLSSGKTTIAAWIAGLGQAEGADVAWVDGENSFDARHISKQGLDPDKVALFESEYGEFKYKKKGKQVIKDEVEAAEDLFDRVEIWMKLRRRQNPDGKLIVVVDSTTSFSPEEEQAAGMKNQNMRTKVSPAVFLNLLTKRWVSLSLHTNALVIYISQLRTNPMQLFGEKDYTPGGRGIGYYSSVLVWMRRISNGEIKRNKRQIGVMGIMSNKKNKAGGGSIERKKCGYKIFFYKNAAEFMSSDELKKESKKQKET